MKKIFTIVILIASMNIGAFAQSSWFWQNPLPQGNYLNNVFFIENSTTGLAVGSNGTILKTINSGTSWTIQTSGTINELYSLHFENNNIGWVVGVLGSILKTTNGGTNWAALSSGTINRLESVHFIDSNTGWSVGASGTILKTTNGGENWTTQTNGEFLNLKDVHFFDNNTGLTCSGNKIFRTTNGGENWTPQTISISNFHFEDNNTGWGLGNSGTILKTINGGSNWMTQSSGTTNSLYSVHFTDNNIGWVVGALGTILKTTNGGTNWTAQSSGITSYLNSVNFADNSIGLAVGPNGRILKTTNGGSNWMMQSSEIISSLYSVHFANNNTGWVAGAFGTILKTTNGGMNWAAQSSGLTTSLYSVIFIDNNTGWVVGASSRILKTTNGGENWTPQTNLPFPNLSFVHFLDNNTGWVVGASGKIIKTIDGGNNWTTQTSGLNNILYSVHFTDNNTGWVVGSSGKIIKTTNGGMNWIQQTSGTPRILYSVHFINDQTGWVVGNNGTGTNGTVLKTTNGGTNWILQESGTSKSLESVQFADNSNGWAVGYQGTIIRTTNGGTNWITQTSGTDGNLNSMHFINPSIVWAVGEGGIILKYNSSASLVITNPNGGETVISGQQMNLTWNLQTVQSVKIEFTSNNGGTWDTIESNYPALTGSYAWTVPNSLSTQCKVRISEVGGSQTDVSDYPFSIVNNPSSLSGQIKNSTNNNFIVGASVTLTSQFNQTLQVNTNNSGEYFFTSLPSGTYSMRISKEGFRTSIENFTITSGANVKNLSLTPDNVNELVLSEGKLKIFADNIYEIEENYFKLTGNVNINGILYFSGEVKVNKRAGYFRPVIESSSRLTAKNIKGTDKTFMNIVAPYKLIVDGNDLIPQTFAYLLDMPIQIQGFPLKLSGISVNNEGTEVQVSTLLKFPYPLDVLAGWAVKKNSTEEEFDALKRFMNSYSGKKIYNRILGEDFELNLSIPDKLRLGFFDLEELDLSWNSQTQVLIGGIKIKVPGSLGNVSDNININSSQFVNQSATVDFVDKNGMLIHRTDINNLHNVLPKDAIAALFALRFELELRAGKIDRVSASLSDVQIPFGIPGFFITEINADVENISAKNSNILIRLTCDIDAGLEEIPFLGPPLTIDNAGGEMVPSSYVKLAGGLKIFDRYISGGSAEFNYKDAFVKVKGEVDILDIIRGDLNSTIKYGYFSGEIAGVLKTPQSFLHPRLKWLNLENRVFSDARIAVENKVITAQTQINYPWRIPIAVRLTFGNPIIVEAGTNLEDLIRIFNHSSDAAQTVSFNVPPNSPGILITADNGINLFDFVMHDPFGRVYDSTNSIYKSYKDVLQTVMYVDKPRAGEWDFITTQTGVINVYPMTVNQSPSQIINTPSNRSSINSTISLKVNDYSDTVDVSVYYDNDNKDFNGSLIKKFRMLNNVNLNFEWNNQSVPDGEYFIYTIVNDGKNAFYSQYAPGSILVDNNDFEEKPLGLSIQQVSDTAKLSWVSNADGRIGFTKIYCMSMKDNSLKYYTALDTNSVKLTDLKFGMKYKIWASYVDTSGNYAPSSDTLEFIYKNALRNNPPLLIAGQDPTWTFIEGEPSTYYMNAFDADGNALNYSIGSKPNGVSVSSNKMQWIPTEDDIGLHYFTLIVSDGRSNDSLRKLVIVRSEREARISLAFSSPNLYDTDNKFLTVKNIRAKDEELSVNLRNLSTNQNSILSCRRINETEFISEVTLATNLSNLFSVAHGDTIEAKYNFNGSEYFTYSVFDTSSQATDNVAPSPVNDLSAFSLATNKVTLIWTAPGDNGMQGEALKYDIRYSYLPITDESSYFTAHKINSYPYPSPAGSTDSMTFDLNNLVDYLQHDTVYFSIKAEDANQNRSPLGNSADHHYIYSATQLNATVAEIYKVNLGWTGVEGPLLKIFGEEVDAAVFKHYRLFRRTDTTEFLLVKDSIIQNTYTDNLYYNADDTYYYALQAVYDIGGSDTIYSEPTVMNRFSDARISCRVSASSNVNDSIQVFITGLDSVYFHSYYALTGTAGIVTFNNVYNSRYAIRIVKEGMSEIIDTIIVNDTISQYNYSFATLMKVRVAIEGMYNILTGKLNFKDTLKIYLRSVTAPYSIADSSLAVLDSSSMYADCTFENAPSGQYFIVVKHRNSIETWSRNGGEPLVKNTVMEFDFTDASLKAFGDNLTQVGSVWCLYGGDINQDGTIDITDASLVDNDAFNFASGYILTDLNGDGITDISDAVYTDNNSFNFVSKITP